MKHTAVNKGDAAYHTYADALTATVKNRSDRLIDFFLFSYFVAGLVFANFYGTWSIALGAGGICITAYYSVKIALPESALYQYVLSAVLGIFMAQFIYQMHGLFEMHFFAFIGSVVLITYQKWKLQLPFLIVVYVHHTIFSYLQDTGFTKIYFSQLDYFDLQTYVLHILLTVVIFFISGMWSYQLKSAGEKQISQAMLLSKAEQETAMLQEQKINEQALKEYNKQLLESNMQLENLRQELQATNTRIQKDNTYYKSIIENKSFYIIKIDAKGNTTYLNPSYCKKMGVEEQYRLGKNASMSILPEDRWLYLEAIEACRAEPDKTHWAILRMLSSGGNLTFHWELSLLQDDKTALSGFLCIGHDITPLIKKQEDLQTSLDMTALQNKTLNNFAYIISHNIRSHVANLKGIIDVTDMSDPEDDRNQSFDMLKTSVDALDETIGHLNHILSIQDNTNLPKKLLNVQDEINRVLQIIQLSLSSSGVSVHSNLSGREQLTTNPAYFESILLNLLTNAIKYRSPNRNADISISMTNEGDYKILMVKDNGLGIDLSKYQDRLFGMYKTFHGNKDAKGLGLFITKKQIEAMRGKIEVESAVGAGSIFKVYFPLN